MQGVSTGELKPPVDTPSRLPRTFHFSLDLVTKMPYTSAYVMRHYRDSGEEMIYASQYI
jgi:hypothetical protein